MTLMGPFEVDPAAVERLGSSFTEFVNSLLATECAQSSIRGWQLRIDSQTNTPDGGVDAALIDATETDWLPSGASAWQFKGRKAFSPSDCAKELADAEWAQELLRKGASYILAVGIRWGAKAIANREKALRTKAKQLGID